MHAQINLAHRAASARAHTATHLLHAQIATLIPTTKQAGSRVGTDELRFDFASERLLTAEEIMQIETNINTIIANVATVETIETSQEEATKLGAKAFFGDKYGSTVRVVTIINEQGTINKEPITPFSAGEGSGMRFFSIELCGGTHVTNTSAIGSFIITGQEAVASGIKRISGLTGPKVIQHYHEKTNLLTSLVTKLDVKSDQQLPEKADKLIKDMIAMQDRLTSLETNLVTQALSTVTKAPNHGCDAIINLDTIPSLASIAIKTIVSQCKTVFAGQVVILYKNDGSFAIFSDDPTRSAKKIATDLGIKGGGSDQLVQGKDTEVSGKIR